MNRTTTSSRHSLILKVILPSLFVGGLVGTAMGYSLAKQRLAQITAQIEAQKRVPVSETVQMSASSASSPAPAFTEATKNENKVEIGSETQEPSSTYPLPTDDQIEKMGDKNFIQGSVQSREVDEKTREVFTVETLPDGSNANRTYREDGSLKGESITYDDGTNLNRNFFESGGVKAAYVKRADGSATSLSYDSSGVPNQQVTQFKDGTQFYTEFDDHGHAVGTYRIAPNGTTEPVGMEGSEVRPEVETQTDEPKSE